jgi:hypothetical protein
MRDSNCVRVAGLALYAFTMSGAAKNGAARFGVTARTSGEGPKIGFRLDTYRRQRRPSDGRPSTRVTVADSADALAEISAFTSNDPSLLADFQCKQTRIEATPEDHELLPNAHVRPLRRFGPEARGTWTGTVTAFAIRIANSD